MPPSNRTPSRSPQRGPFGSRERPRHGRAASEAITTVVNSQWHRKDSLPTPRLKTTNESEEDSSTTEDESEDESDDEAEVGQAYQGGAGRSSTGAEPTLNPEEPVSTGGTRVTGPLHERSRSDNSANIGNFRQNGTKSKLGESSEDEKEATFTFDQLVERLLSQPMSKSDANFVTIFLCLYRKFAAPSELLAALIQHFEDTSNTELPQLIRLTSQLRHLAILRDWVADYPGDFAHSLTRRMMTNFLQGIASNQAFAVAHKEIFQHLDVVSEDDDTAWACSDKSRSRASTMESYLTRSSIQSTNSTVTADSSTEDISEPLTAEKDLARKSIRISSTSSARSSDDRSTGQLTSSTQTSLHTVENAQRQAQLLSPIPRLALDKIRWHQIMNIPDEQIARELTRIDWILYSAVRPRDLVRHISLSADQKEHCRSLEHVNRMINQFNHVAFWVAHWILLRDKPKHRAKALEKFMNVAWKLRHLNNYNSLGAVIAGINGTAIHRLTQTRDLIDPAMQKQFMRLEILMGTQKSHFAYRLAWENTSTPRIPFLPLHRRDLVFAEEANKTFAAGTENEYINWKKFEVMGQTIVEVRKSQQLPYSPIKRHEEIQRLLLDGAFSKEDDVR